MINTSKIAIYFWNVKKIKYSTKQKTDVGVLVFPKIISNILNDFIWPSHQACINFFIFEEWHVVILKSDIKQHPHIYK